MVFYYVLAFVSTRVMTSPTSIAIASWVNGIEEESIH